MSRTTCLLRASAAFRPSFTAPVAVFQLRTKTVAMSNVEPKTTIKRDGKFYEILAVTSQAQGRAGPTLKVRMEDLSTGKHLVDVPFRPAENVELVDVSTRTLNLLYHTRDVVHVIDLESGEELELPIGSFAGGEASLAFYDEVTPITVTLVEDTIIKAEGPSFVNTVVKEVDDSKGAQASDHRQTTYSATLSSGAQIVVPTFIKVGDRIRYDVLQKRFLGRSAS